MGRKRSGARKHLYLCVAGLILLVLGACVPVRIITAEQESRTHLRSVQNLMRQGDFAAALRENQRVLSVSAKKPPGDAALFAMGLIHIHYGNPKKDYRKALSYFSQLQKDFPRSPLTEEAKVWVGVLEAMEKTMQIDIEIEEKKKELTR